GGRGKAGGVKLAKSPEEAAEIASQLIGATLVTHQTGPEGKEVRRLLVEEGMNIEKEFYVGITLDRSTSRNVLMVSTEGGMEIEKVAEETPERLLKIQIDPLYGIQPFQAREAAFFLQLQGEQFKNAVSFITSLCLAYTSIDASLAEINPLVVTKEGKVLALDAKINFDDNALFRHKDFLELRDIHEEDPLEVEASKSNLNYVKLDGNVGCMVNGAGLAMATMDIIQLAGGKPANFLDVGGGASPKTVEEGFKIILGDQHVKAILVNIFGGIVRCDRVAGGIIEAAKKIDLHLPVIVRLEGTNASIAQKMLDESGLNLISANGLKDASEKIHQALSAV
ncbi:MAG: ADP-forming succinate--CoA ligase subunit beta, partial [Chlorobiaceae bacterium]|nr:ADP-forming succinate--CoA ligase subunit beta [Chlorobiaceae bacterium]